MGFVLFTDGGSRNNPGPAGCGFDLQLNGSSVLSGGWFLGVMTNNQAEYHGLIWGLQNALAAGARTISLRADSELIVKQLQGTYKVKNVALKPLYEEARRQLARFDAWDIQHVYREHNKVADRRANEAMDAKGPAGTFAVALGDEDAQPSLFAEAPEPIKPVQPKGVSMYELTIKGHFDAAHRLVNYPGECANLHGHTWDVEVSVCGSELDNIGILYDFKALKDDLNSILDQYDHNYVNDVPPFNVMNPTAENFAREIYNQLAAKLPSHVAVSEVVVWESPVAKLSYRRV